MPNKNYQPFLESLDKLGFSTFQVFEDAEISALKELYVSHFARKEIVSLYASHNSNPIEKSLSISKCIKEIVQPKLQVVFPEYDYFIGHFIVKGANTEREFSLHQDWNIVDESRYKSYQIWIPLQLSYPTNGGIFVVPGSHQFFSNFRSGSYGIPVVPFDDVVEPIVTNIIIPEGNILAYHNGLFHASHPNKTNEDRVAVIVNFVERKASTYYFHKNEQEKCTDLHAISGETLIQHLPHLEKGIVDSSLEFKLKMPLCTINSERITSADLESGYRKLFGEKPASQLKQLHIAKDMKLEDLLNQEGYAIVDFLSEDEVEKFKTEYLRRFGGIDRNPGRFTSLQEATPTEKRQVHNFILQNVQIPLTRWLKDYVIPVSLFYTKKAFTSGDIDLHADTTLLLNHQLEPHYAFWVPLVDVDETNGTLTVIPRSHKIQGAFFSYSIGGYHKEHISWLRQFEVPVKLKAGQAIIFDNNLLHNSTANTTPLDRLCFTFRVTHHASQYYSFFSKNADAFEDVEISEETQSYFMDDNWNGNAVSVTGKQKGTYQKGVTKVIREELEKILNVSYS